MLLPDYKAVSSNSWSKSRATKFVQREGGEFMENSWDGSAERVAGKKKLLGWDEFNAANWSRSFQTPLEPHGGPPAIQF